MQVPATNSSDMTPDETDYYRASFTSKLLRNVGLEWTRLNYYGPSVRNDRHPVWGRSNEEDMRPIDDNADTDLYE